MANNKFKISMLFMIFICTLLLCNNVYAYDDIRSREAISVNEMKQDFDLVVKNIHTNYNILTEKQLNILKECEQQIQEPKTKTEFYLVLSKVFASFNDLHTYIYSGDISGSQHIYLGIPIIWLDEGIIVSKDFGEYKKGDKILKIGGKDAKELEQLYSTVLFSENKYSLHAYSSDNLLNKLYLEYFNLINYDNTVDVLLEHNGEIKILKEMFTNNYISSYDGKYKNWVDFNIEKDNSIGYFYLNSCVENRNPDKPNEYENTVNDFFEKVSQNDINTIVLDLRDNGGGGPGLIMKFMDNLNVKSYNLQNNIGFNSPVHYNPNFNKKSLFNGKVYVLTGNETASAAVLITDIFRDNKLATIVGEPTSQRANYNNNGIINTFTLPNSKFNCRIQSNRLINRPISKNGGENTIYPDIYIPKTAENIINDTDPHMEYIKKFSKQNEQYKKWEKLLIVSNDHKFTIKFNKSINGNSVNSDNIYIENNFGVKYEVKVELIDSKTITIKSERNFLPEMTYTLFFKNITDNNSNSKIDMKVDFIINQ